MSLRIWVPEQDSQYRLLRCRGCRRAVAGYQQTQEGPRTIYRVKCGGCGQVTPWWGCKHDAQLDWNRRYGEPSTERRT